MRLATGLPPRFAGIMSRRRSRPPSPPVQSRAAQAGEHGPFGDASHLASGYRHDHDAHMRHVLHSMIVDGDARQVVQTYLKAKRAGENAEQAAASLIGRLRPALTLAEPTEMLERLLTWVAAEHGEWWRKALLRRPPSLEDLSPREFHRRRGRRGE